MDIQAWYERVTKNVSQSGQCVAAIRLMCAQQMWHVWAIDPKREPEEWAAEASAILADLSEQWSARKWQVLLIAEDKSGQILSQCPFEVLGKNKSAQMGTAPTDNVKVYAEAMENIQRTWERTLSVVNEQLSLQQKQMNEQGQRYIQMMGYVNEAEQYRATEPQRLAALAGVAAKDPLKEQLVEAMPQILELVSKLVEKRQTAAGVAGAAATTPLKAVAT